MFEPYLTTHDGKLSQWLPPRLSYPRLSLSCIQTAVTTDKNDNVFKFFLMRLPYSLLHGSGESNGEGLNEFKVWCDDSFFELDVTKRKEILLSDRILLLVPFTMKLSS